MENVIENKAIMKKIVLATAFFALCATSACKTDPDWAAGTLNPTVSISDVRFLYKGNDRQLTTDDLSGAVQISGVVSSNYAEKNVPEGIVIIQNTFRSKTSGIAVHVGPELASTFQPGDSLLLQIAGKTLTRENGALTIRSLNSTEITVLSTGHKLSPIPVTAATLEANPEAYESILVRVSNCTPEDPSAENPSYKEGLTVGDGTGTLTIYAREGSDLATLTVPEEPATYIGLVFTEAGEDGNTQLFIQPRSLRDVIEKYIVLAWNLTGHDNIKYPTRDATVVNANLEMSALSRGPGLTAQKAGNAFASEWPMDISKEAAIERGSYYQFTITPKNNAQVSLLSLDVALRVQPNGPKNYIWMYSLDNGENFSEMSGNLVFKGSTTDNNGIQQPTLNLEEVAGVQEFSEPMIVRIYAWGAADAKSTFRIGQSLANRPYALTLEGMIRP